MIITGSRYFNGNYRVSNSTVEVHRRFPTPQPTLYREHVWTEYDRLDVLASRMLGDPRLWWRIMDLNPLVQSPDDLVPGMVVRVPIAS